MEMTIDEIIGHCKRVCKIAEIGAAERCMRQEDIQSKRYWEHYYVAKYLEELKRMKDAEEQGLLHKTPCKMGDTIYFIDEESGKVFQSIVARFWIAKLQSFVIDYDGRRFNFKQFGKTWFLDSEEAESALAEKGGA